MNKFLICITMSIYVNRNELNNAFCLWKYLNISLNSNKRYLLDILNVC